MSVFPNKRSSERIDATLLVYYKKHGSQMGYDLSQTANISSGGVMLTTSFAYKVNDVLDLKLVSPINSDGDIVLAQVRGCEQVIPDIMYRTRVQFIETEPEQDFLIKQLIEKYGTGVNNGT